MHGPYTKNIFPILTLNLTHTTSVILLSSRPRLVVWIDRNSLGSKEDSLLYRERRTKAGNCRGEGEKAAGGAGTAKAQTIE